MKFEKFCNMKIIFTSIALLFLLVLSGCQSSKRPLEDSNYQTFRISSGVLASIKPPSGFQVTTEHYGFVQPESFSRIKIEEIELGRDLYLEQLTKENLLQNKLMLLSQQQIDVSGSNCELLTLRQEIAGIFYEKVWLISGDALSSIKVEASYPQGTSSIQKSRILESLKSISIETNQLNRVFTGLPFTLSNFHNYKPTQRFTNSLVLEPIENNSNSSVVISHGVIQSELDKISQLSDYFLNNKQLENVEKTSHEFIKVDNTPAFSAQAYATINERQIWIYQVTASSNKKFLLIQGMTNKDNRNQFEQELKTLLNDFKFK